MTDPAALSAIPTPSASPFLFCADVDASMAFLQAAFGFERLSCADGHGHARLGDTYVFLSNPHADSGMVPANQLPGLHALVMVYVDDVDALTERAAAAGARIDYGPTDMPYGQREAGIRDLDGNLWSFATARST